MTKDLATLTVPMNDLSRTWIATGSLAIEAASRVLGSGRYLLGAESSAFEHEMAAYLGVDDAIAVASGTDALVLALLGIGIEAGSEVVVAANAGAYASVAVALIGARVVYADVDGDTACVTAESVLRVVGPRTAAVVVTHLYGNMADVVGIAEGCAERGIHVIEDCAQAIGVRHDGIRAGAVGLAAAFSFYPTKNLGAAGDAGAVLTSDAGVAARVRQLRQYGWADRYRIDLGGGRNSRIDELQAALLRIGLRTIDERNERRRHILARYRAAAPGLRWVTGSSPTVAHLAVLRVEDRPGARAALDAAGIATDVHYPIADHHQVGLPRPIRGTALPETERIVDEVVSVPCFPELRDDEVERVAEGLADL